MGLHEGPGTLELADILLWAVLATRLASLVLGSWIVIMAFKGYRRTNARSMGFLATGMALITIGAFVEGVLLQFLGWTPNEAHALESSLNVLGFLMILYSIRGSDQGSSQS